MRNGADRYQPSLGTAERRAPAEGTPSIITMTGGALAIAIVMSTQFLFQPFVWANWDWQDVLAGWLDIARDDAILSLCVAAALVAAFRFRGGPPAVRAALQGVAIVIGALAGQALLMRVGSPDAAIDLWSLFARALRWAVIATVLSIAYYYWRRDADASARLDEARRVTARAERTVAAARLTALRRQIEPHFLFNTLATIRQLYQSGPVEGRSLLSHLLTFVQATLASAPDAFSTLGREVDLAEAYLLVFKARMGGRLEVSVAVEDGLRDIAIPPFTLATLVENAIKHGIAPSPTGGAVRIVARRQGDHIEIAVVDSGVGFSGESGSGTGLANVRARLQALYPAGAACRITANEDRGVTAMLVIPADQP